MSSSRQPFGSLISGHPMYVWYTCQQPLVLLLFFYLLLLCRAPARWREKFPLSTRTVWIQRNKHACATRLLHEVLCAMSRVSTQRAGSSASALNSALLTQRFPPPSLLGLCAEMLLSLFGLSGVNDYRVAEMPHSSVWQHWVKVIP